MAGAKHIAAQALPMVGTVLGSMIPGVGPIVGPMIGSALGSAGGAALNGGSLGQVAQAGAMGGASSALGSVGQGPSAVGQSAQPQAPLAAATSQAHHGILHGLGGFLKQNAMPLLGAGAGYALGGGRGAMAGLGMGLLPEMFHGHQPDHGILPHFDGPTPGSGMVGPGGWQANQSPGIMSLLLGLGGHGAVSPMAAPQTLGNRYEQPAAMPWWGQTVQKAMPGYAQ